MIILDTNIISEMMKKSPSANVIAWLDRQDVMRLFITTITIAEIAYGIHAVRETKRQRHLENAFDKVINEAFKHRILAFNESAAYFYGKIMGLRKKAGRPLSILDGQIAAIALAEKKVVATRNTRDFVGCEIDLINPFEE